MLLIFIKYFFFSFYFHNCPVLQLLCSKCWIVGLRALEEHLYYRCEVVSCLEQKTEPPLYWPLCNYDWGGQNKGQLRATIPVYIWTHFLYQNLRGKKKQLQEKIPTEISALRKKKILLSKHTEVSWSYWRWKCSQLVCGVLTYKRGNCLLETLQFCINFKNSTHHCWCINKYSSRVKSTT